MVDDEQPPPGPVADRRDQFDLGDGGEHPHATAVVDARRGGVVGMNEHLGGPTRRMQARAVR